MTMSAGAASPLVRYPSTGVVLPPRYCGSVGYYALMSAYGDVKVDWSAPFNKRSKEVHRAEIADTRGRLRLTVPIAKPESSSTARWSDIRVSAHGDWWAVHLTALESAYGRTPYFEFYIDRFTRFFTPRSGDGDERITDLAAGIDSEIRSILGIAPDGSQPAAVTDTIDFTSGPLPELPGVEYYQIRADKLGFIPALSILDLIFNMGPESPLILKRMTDGY